MKGLAPDVECWLYLALCMILWVFLLQLCCLLKSFYKSFAEETLVEMRPYHRTSCTSGQGGWTTWMGFLSSRLKGVLNLKALHNPYMLSFISFRMLVKLDIYRSFISGCRMTETTSVLHSWWARPEVHLLRTVAIPRLALTAAVLAVRVDLILKAELKLYLQEYVFWTDSTSVLKYMKKDKCFHTFVANRVLAIRGATTASQWRYVGSKENPADDGSRGFGDFIQDNR